MPLRVRVGNIVSVHIHTLRIKPTPKRNSVLWASKGGRKGQTQMGLNLQTHTALKRKFPLCVAVHWYVHLQVKIPSVGSGFRA